MQLFVMLITLSGSFGFTGGAPVIQGFHSLAACEKAIPAVRAGYPSADKVQCVELAAD